MAFGHRRVTIQEKRCLLLKWVGQSCDEIHAQHGGMLLRAWRGEHDDMVSPQGMPDYRVEAP